MLIDLTRDDRRAYSPRRPENSSSRSRSNRGRSETTVGRNNMSKKDNSIKKTSASAAPQSRSSVAPAVPLPRGSTTTAVPQVLKDLVQGATRTSSTTQTTGAAQTSRGNNATLSAQSTDQEVDEFLERMERVVNGSSNQQENIKDKDSGAETGVTGIVRLGRTEGGGDDIGECMPGSSRQGELRFVNGGRLHSGLVVGGQPKASGSKSSDKADSKPVENSRDQRTAGPASGPAVRARRGRLPVQHLRRMI